MLFFGIDIFAHVLSALGHVKWSALAHLLRGARRYSITSTICTICTNG